MNDTSAFFIFVLLLIALIAVAFSPLYLTYKMSQKTRAWRFLATSTQLIFSSGKFPGDARLFGHYRGHSLRLETFNDTTKDNDLYTRIVLSAGSESSRYLLKNGSFNKDYIDVKNTVRLFTGISSNYTLKGHIKVTAKGQMISYQQSGVEGDIAYLKAVFNLLCNIADYYSAVVTIGGGAVPYLQAIAADTNHILHPVTIQLLQEIAQETKLELQDKEVIEYLLCPTCLARYAANKVSVPGIKPIVYNGCRVCGQNQDFMEWDGQMIAVLNNKTVDEKSWGDKILRVNWLARHTLFDFDKVEIMQATDEDVERFAMQTGNDGDNLRQKRYKQIHCYIAPHCQLSENTMRILQRTFGRVDIK